MCASHRLHGRWCTSVPSLRKGINNPCEREVRTVREAGSQTATRRSRTSGTPEAAGGRCALPLVVVSRPSHPAPHRSLAGLASEPRLRCCAVRAPPALQPRAQAEQQSGAQRHSRFRASSARTMRKGSHDMSFSDHDAASAAGSCAAEEEPERPKLVAASHQTASEGALQAGALSAISARQTPVPAMSRRQQRRAPLRGRACGARGAVPQSPSCSNTLWRSSNPACAWPATVRRRVAQACAMHNSRATGAENVGHDVRETGRDENALFWAS